MSEKIVLDPEAWIEEIGGDYPLSASAGVEAVILVAAADSISALADHVARGANRQVELQRFGRTEVSLGVSVQSHLISGHKTCTTGAERDIMQLTVVRHGRKVIEKKTRDL
jgi:hypothetical protein